MQIRLFVNISGITYWDISTENVYSVYLEIWEATNEKMQYGLFSYAN